MWWLLIGQAGTKKPRIVRHKSLDSDDDMNAMMNDDHASASALGSNADHGAPTHVKPAKKASSAKKVIQNDDSDDCFIVASSKLHTKPKAAVAANAQTLPKPVAVKNKIFSKYDDDEDEEHDGCIKRAKPAVTVTKAPLLHSKDIASFFAKPKVTTAVKNGSRPKLFPSLKTKNNSYSEVSFCEDDGDSDVADVTIVANSSKAPRRAAAD